jgi:hypothetical protein
MPKCQFGMQMWAGVLLLLHCAKMRCCARLPTLPTPHSEMVTCKATTQPPPPPPLYHTATSTIVSVLRQPQQVCTYCGASPHVTAGVTDVTSAVPPLLSQPSVTPSPPPRQCTCGGRNRCHCEDTLCSRCFLRLRCCCFPAHRNPPYNRRNCILLAKRPLRRRYFFRLRFRCFSAATTIFSAVARPLRLRVMSMYLWKKARDQKPIWCARKRSMNARDSKKRVPVNSQRNNSAAHHPYSIVTLTVTRLKKQREIAVCMQHAGIKWFNIPRTPA